MSMTSILAVLCIALSLQIACCTDDCSDVSSASSDAKQCLMQKKHQVSKSGSIYEKPRHGPVAAAEKEILAQSGNAQAASTKAHGKKKQQDAGADHKHHKNAKQSHPKKGAAQSFAQVGKGAVHTLDERPSINLKELLPPDVLAVGLELFKTEDAVSGAVANSVPVDITYAGIKMSLRMNKFDDAVKRMGEEGQWFSYDLDTLNDAERNSEDMLNMIDVGGNYGVVTIAAMKKHPRLRVITVEPTPETFFFLKWNLALNEIPEIDATALDEKNKPGVLALQRGSSDVAGTDLHLCVYPWSSMNSKVCDCIAGEDNCQIVPSTSIADLASMFGTEPIALVKMDCEGCEFKTLPALAEPEIAKRVHRLAGELHLPDRSLEEFACRWDNGRYMSKCQRSATNSEDVQCDVKLDCPDR